MKANYWVVIWGDKVEDNPASGPLDPQNFPSHIRVTQKRYEDPKLACKECWGIASGNMWVRPFSNRKEMQVNKRRALLFDVKSKKGWTRMHPTDKWELRRSNG